MEDAAGGLAMLAARVDTAMVPLGFERDTRPFHPHVTLGRVRGSRNLDRLRSLMESITFDGPPVTLHELCLMKSVIRPDGSVYSTLQIVPLVGNRADTK
jgi:2'-5' RNA ligase